MRIIKDAEKARPKTPCMTWGIVLITACVAALGCAASSMASAADKDLSYASAKRIWDRTKHGRAYQRYAEEFVQSGNRFQMPEAQGCRALDPEPMEMMLVISRQTGEQQAAISQVIPKAAGPKSKCYKEALLAAPAKAPPFLPFVLYMKME